MNDLEKAHYSRQLQCDKRPPGRELIDAGEKYIDELLKTTR